MTLLPRSTALAFHGLVLAALLCVGPRHAGAQRDEPGDQAARLVANGYTRLIVADNGSVSLQFDPAGQAKYSSWQAQLAPDGVVDAD